MSKEYKEGDVVCYCYDMRIVLLGSFCSEKNLEGYSFDGDWWYIPTAYWRIKKLK